MAARRKSEGAFEVRVDVESSAQHLEAQRILRAVCHAFGFLLGRMVTELGYEEHTNDQETQVLLGRPSNSDGQQTSTATVAAVERDECRAVARASD